MSRVSKGNYYRLRTKKWFEKKGFWVETIEKTQRIFVKGMVIFKKSDLAGADLLAMDGAQIIFANSVFGKKNVASHLKEFAKYPYPAFVERWVVVWEKGWREPEIIEFKGEGENEKKD